MHRCDPVKGERKLRILLVSTCAVLIVAAGLNAAETSPSNRTHKRKSPTGAMLRSMVVPGWGQLYNGKPLKALIYAGAQLGFIWGAHVQNDRYHYYRHLGWEVDADFYKNDRNRQLWWLFGVTLLSMGDAFVDAHLYGFDISDDLSINISPSVSPDFAGCRLGFSIKLKVPGFLPSQE